MEFLVLYICLILLTALVLGISGLFAFIAVNACGKIFSKIFASDATSEEGENNDEFNE